MRYVMLGVNIVLILLGVWMIAINDLGGYGLVGQGIVMFAITFLIDSASWMPT